MAKQVTGLARAMKAAEGKASAHSSGVMASSTTQRTLSPCHWHGELPCTTNAACRDASGVKQPMPDHPGGSSKRRAAAAGSEYAAIWVAAARDKAAAAASDEDTNDDAGNENAVRMVEDDRGAVAAPADSDSAARQAAARHARIATGCRTQLAKGGELARRSARKNGSRVWSPKFRLPGCEDGAAAPVTVTAQSDWAKSHF